MARYGIMKVGETKRFVTHYLPPEHSVIAERIYDKPTGSTTIPFRRFHDLLIEGPLMPSASASDPAPVALDMSMDTSRQRRTATFWFKHAPEKTWIMDLGPEN
jgi:hypothetical protein